jgi:hypothetical protein
MVMKQINATIDVVQINNSKCEVCVMAEYNIIENRIPRSRSLSEFQNATSVATPIIKKDANISGIKKLMKKEIGVAINIANATHTNVRNDN